MGSLWHIAMASGWRSEGLWFDHRQPQATFDPELPKITNNSQPSVPLMKKIRKAYLKRLKKAFQDCGFH